MCEGASRVASHPSAACRRKRLRFSGTSAASGTPARALPGQGFVRSYKRLRLQNGGASASFSSSQCAAQTMLWRGCCKRCVTGHAAQVQALKQALGVAPPEGFSFASLAATIGCEANYSILDILRPRAPLNRCNARPAWRTRRTEAIHFAEEKHHTLEQFIQLEVGSALAIGMSLSGRTQRCNQPPPRSDFLAQHSCRARLGATRSSHPYPHTRPCRHLIPRGQPRPSSTNSRHWRLQRPPHQRGQSQASIAPCFRTC